MATDTRPAATKHTTMGFPDRLIQHLRHVSRDYQHGIFSRTNDIVGDNAPANRR